MWIWTLLLAIAILSLMTVFGVYQPLSRRPRRNRKSPVLRAAFQETQISPANFVYPLFIHEGLYWCGPFCYRLVVFCFWLYGCACMCVYFAFVHKLVSVRMIWNVIWQNLQVRRTHLLELCLDVIGLGGDMDLWKRWFSSNWYYMSS